MGNISIEERAENLRAKMEADAARLKNYEKRIAEKQKAAAYKRQAAVGACVEELFNETYWKEDLPKLKEKINAMQRQAAIGAGVESVLGKTIEEEKIPNLTRFLEDQERRGQFFSRAMEKE